MITQGMISKHASMSLHDLQTDGSWLTKMTNWSDSRETYALRYEVHSLVFRCARLKSEPRMQ